MLLWGWRVPFLAAIPIIAVALVLRVQMQESSEFLALKGAPAPAAGGGADGAAAASPAGGSGGGCCSRRQPGSVLVEAVTQFPAAQLLRRAPLGFILQAVYVSWLSSVLYVVFAYIPAAVRADKVMPPIVSLGMVLTSLAAEFAGIVAGGWAAPRMPCLVVCSVTAPIISLFVLGTLGAMDSRSVAAIWILHNLGLGLAGFVFGVHAACFVYVYAVAIRSTGFSLSYNVGCALGGSAPAIVTALQLATGKSAQTLASRLIPAVWLLALSVPAAGACLWLLRVAPLVNGCGRSTWRKEGKGGGDDASGGGLVVVAE
jgi:hypothetical protein